MSTCSRTGNIDSSIYCFYAFCICGWLYGKFDVTKFYPNESSSLFYFHVSIVSSQTRKIPPLTDDASKSLVSFMGKVWHWRQKFGLAYLASFSSFEHVVQSLPEEVLRIVKGNAGLLLKIVEEMENLSSNDLVLLAKTTKGEWEGMDKWQHS